MGPDHDSCIDISFLDRFLEVGGTHECFSSISIKEAFGMEHGSSRSRSGIEVDFPARRELRPVLTVKSIARSCDTERETRRAHEKGNGKSGERSNKSKQ